MGVSSKLFLVSKGFSNSFFQMENVKKRYMLRKISRIGSLDLAFLSLIISLISLFKSSKGGNGGGNRGPRREGGNNRGPRGNGGNNRGPRHE